MSKARMMYAFDHIPTTLNYSGGYVNTYSDFPFTFNQNSAGLANSTPGGTLSDADGVWLATQQYYYSSTSTTYIGNWSLPTNVVMDVTKSRGWIGFRFKWSGTSKIGVPFSYQRGGTNVPLLLAADYAWVSGQSYYVEICIDRVNKTRTVWVDGAMVVNGATVDSAQTATDSFYFGTVASLAGSSTCTYQYKDMYFMDDPADGSVSRLGPILAKSITLASGSGNGWTPYTFQPLGTAVLSSTWSQFGGSSAYVTGGAGGFQQPDNSNLHLTGNWTIECWCNMAANNDVVLVDKSQSGTAAQRAYIEFNVRQLQIKLDGTGAAQTIGSSTGLPAFGTAFHLAVVQNSGTITAYVNGASIGTLTTSATFGNNSGPLTICNQYNNAATNFAGYVDEFRISNTARYTANFTVPAAAFGVDANTVCLAHFDSLVNGAVQDVALSNDAIALNTAINPTAPSVPNVTSAGDGTALVTPLATTADAGATVQGVMLVASGQRAIATGTTFRATLSDQASNQLALTPTQFPAGAFAYGRTLGFLPNALDGTSWTTTKVGQLSLSSVASAT